MPAEAATEIITFGCRLNRLESEVMRRHAQAAGLADAVIVHTCMDDVCDRTLIGRAA